MVSRGARRAQRWDGAARAPSESTGASTRWPRSSSNALRLAKKKNLTPSTARRISGSWRSKAGQVTQNTSTGASGQNGATIAGRRHTPRTSVLAATVVWPDELAPRHLRVDLVECERARRATRRHLAHRRRQRGALVLLEELVRLLGRAGRPAGVAIRWEALRARRPHEAVQSAHDDRRTSAGRSTHENSGSIREPAWIVLEPLCTIVAGCPGRP